MRIDPVIKIKEDPFKNLTKVEKYARKAAIALAFVAVFVWLFKIVF
jgi:hypothetical protein